MLRYRYFNRIQAYAFNRRYRTRVHKGYQQPPSSLSLRSGTVQVLLECPSEPKNQKFASATILVRIISGSVADVDPPALAPPLPKPRVTKYPVAKLGCFVIWRTGFCIKVIYTLTSDQKVEREGLRPSAPSRNPQFSTKPAILTAEKYSRGPQAFLCQKSQRQAFLNSGTSSVLPHLISY